MTNFKQDKLAREQIQVELKASDELPNGEFVAILSTSDLDRHGEIVSIKGIEIPKRVIKMYYNHRTYGEALPIGKWLKIWKEDGKLMGHGRVDLEDDFAVKVYKKVKGGFLDSISIGFYPREFDGETGVWTKTELVEASVVAEPANPEAVVTQKELGFTEEEFDQAFKVKLKETKQEEAEEETKEKTDEQEKDSGDESGTDDLAEVKSAIEDLNSRMGAVEEANKAAADNPTQKNLIKVRVALKEVDHSVEKANRTLKVKLKEGNSNE